MSKFIKHQVLQTRSVHDLRAEMRRLEAESWEASGSLSIDHVGNFYIVMKKQHD